MRMLKLAGTIPALALVTSLSVSADVQASTLVVDRGLPDTNLNNAAGGARSNVAWGFTPPDSDDPNAPTTKFQSGDTFSLPSTGNANLPSWRIDKLSAWFIAGSTGDDVDPLEDRFSDISLFLGSGNTIDKVASSSITGDVADASNVTISKVTYTGGADYQGSSGNFIQLWQVDFTDLGTFSAGNYAFSLAGLPDEKTILFNHASNAALGGVPADGADNQYAWLSGSAADSSLTLGGFIDSDGNGWDKSSDINVQVYASPVPLPAAGWLLLTAFGGLGIAARRRKAA